jgi:hypothetical protein
MVRVIGVTALLLASLGMGYLGSQLGQRDRAAVAADPAVTEVLRAKSLFIVNADDEPVMILSAKDGKPALMIGDTPERMRLCLGVNAEGDPLIGLMDKSGKSRLLIGQTQHGGVLFFNKANGDTVYRIAPETGLVGPPKK